MRRMTWQALIWLPLLATSAWSGTVGGEAGAAFLGGDLFWVIRFTPELDVGRFGAGLDVELLMQREGLRDDDWASSHQWVRLIRYVRWGVASDPVHLRLGALNALTVGRGLMVSRYTNWYDEDYRRLGVHACARARRVGLDAFSSSVGRQEILGARLWIEPFSRPAVALGPWRFGFSVVADDDPDADRRTGDGVTIVGFDSEFPLVQGSPAGCLLYGEAASILRYGTGGAAGIGIDLGTMAMFSGLQCRLERRFLGARFLPAYMDAFYGVARFDPATGLRKRDLLDATGAHGGWYAELQGTLAGTASLVAGFSRRNGSTGSGAFHVDVAPLAVGQRVQLRASLDATGIETLSDLTESGKTLIELWAGYRLNGWASCYLRFLRTFEKADDGAYRPVDVISPRLTASLAF